MSGKLAIFVVDSNMKILLLLKLLAWLGDLISLQTYT